jgi:hypothetical protein
MLHNISPERVITAMAEMGLPEPFVWAHWEHGELCGMVTGHIKRFGSLYLDVDYMIVLPAAKNKLRTMLRMSEDATQAAFAQGCDLVLLSILHEDTRRRGLDAWARRCSYLKYTTTETADWYARRRPTKEDHGQEGFRSEASAAPDAARPER